MTKAKNEVCNVSLHENCYSVGGISLWWVSLLEGNFLLWGMTKFSITGGIPSIPGSKVLRSLLGWVPLPVIGSLALQGVSVISINMFLNAARYVKVLYM